MDSSIVCLRREARRVSIVAAIISAGCASPSPDDGAQSSAEVQATTAFGDPLPGLASAEQARFNAGKAGFAESESAAEGLGPVFNDVSCGACHAAPALGGGSDRVETRFGAINNGQFDPLAGLGGSLIQERGIGVAGRCNFVGEIVPAQANVKAGRRTTPLFGLGLVDAVPDATFRALAANEARTSPSTAGVVSDVTNIATGSLSVGKFGWKAQNPTLFQFAGDAYINEMGVTSPEFPDEVCPQGDCALLACNPAPGLNDDGTDVRAFADFMTMLAPPPRAPSTPQAQEGEVRFGKIGCTNCHAPTLTTGASPIAALANVTFHPYSDFLLHDMGSLGDGIQQNAATGALMRTAPLWGLRGMTTFLHDARARSVEGAVLAHDGQAKAARDAFVALPDAQKQKVLAFLASL